MIDMKDGFDTKGVITITPLGTNRAIEVKWKSWWYGGYDVNFEFEYDGKIDKDFENLEALTGCDDSYEITEELFKECSWDYVNEIFMAEIENCKKQKE